MSDGEAASPGGLAAPGDRAAFAALPGGIGVLPFAAVLLAAAIAAGALLVNGAAEPLLLALLSLLAMMGVFFAAGLWSGHIRFAERAREADLVTSLCADLQAALLVTDRNGVAVYANAAMQALAGRVDVGRVYDIDALFAGDTMAGEALFRLHRAALRGETSTEELSQVSGPHGKRLIRVTNRPLKMDDETGAVPGLVVWTLADITDERALNQDRVRALENALAFSDTAPVGLMATRNDGHVRYINATFANWLGLSRRGKRVAEMTLADVISVGGQALLTGALRRTAGAAANVDLDITCDDGRVLPMRFVARKVSDGLLIAASGRDREGASSGNGSDAGLPRLFQSAPFGIAVVDAERRVTNANAAFARLLGNGGVAERADDVLCRGVDADTRSRFGAALSEVLAGRVSAPMELTVADDERKATVRVYLSPLSTREGAREAAILYVIDATEQKALEAKFAQSSKMEAVGNLAGGIAHDFNNVLTAIIGFSDLLLQTHRPKDPAYKDIMNIRSSANRAAGLVAKLLAFSRRQTLQSEPLHMGEVLSDISNLLRRSLGEKVELRTPPARDLWFVKADRTQIDQVLINFAVNAKDAMPDGGSVTVRTRNVTERDSQREAQKPGQESLIVGEYVLIEVEDTGMGMTPEVRAKIFEPFFTTKGVGKGTGLGLATVYGIIKQSGGYIFLDSEPGVGTTFRVYLPRHVPENEDEIPAVKAKKEAPKDLTGSGRVLLVEDEDFVRSFAVRALTRLGYEVLEATSGVDALEVMAANEGRVDIVVSDVVMPEMDGPALLKELRKQNPGLKIIFVSGYPNEAFETSLDKDQEFAFLAKPFSMPQLAAKVKEQLGR